MSANFAVCWLLVLGGGAALYRSVFMDSSTQRPAIGYIEEVQGTIEIRANRSSGWVRSKQSSPVYHQSYIYTSSRSRTTVKLRGAQLKVDEKTLVYLVDPQDQADLSLNMGTIGLNAEAPREIVVKSGGKKVKIRLQESEVVLKKVNHQELKIESKKGQVEILDLAKSDPQPVIISKGETYHTEKSSPPDLALESQEPEVVPLEPEPVEPRFQTGYTSDRLFAQRPFLSASFPSEVSKAEVFISFDEVDWNPIPGLRFEPDRAGKYFVKTKGVRSDATEFETPALEWEVNPEHYLHHQPRTLISKMEWDPLRAFKGRLYSEDFDEDILVFQNDRGDVFHLEPNQEASWEAIPPSVNRVRVLAGPQRPIAFEKRDLEVRIRVGGPKALVIDADQKIQFPSLKRKQFRYGVIEGGQQIKLAYQETSYLPKCDRCVVQVFYLSEADPLWRSEEQRIEIVKPTPVSRVLASEKTEPQSEIQIQQPLLEPLLKVQLNEQSNLEFGLGGNYLSMGTSSTYTSASSSGLSGPSLYIAGAKETGSGSWKGSFLNVHSRMKNKSESLTQTQELDWRTLWGGRAWPGLWKFHRLEAGLSYQEVPLFYESGAGVGEFEKGKWLGPTLGFNNAYTLSSNSYLLWDQRLILPVQGSGSGQVNSFKPQYGIDGTLSYYICSKGAWAWGASWFGQYLQGGFGVTGTDTLRADNPKTTMLNSNLQLRMQFGFCK